MYDDLAQVGLFRRQRERREAEHEARQEARQAREAERARRAEARHAARQAAEQRQQAEWEARRKRQKTEAEEVAERRRVARVRRQRETQLDQMRFQLQMAQMQKQMQALQAMTSVAQAAPSTPKAATPKAATPKTSGVTMYQDDVAQIAGELTAHYGLVPTNALINFGRTVILRPGTTTGSGRVLTGAAIAAALGDDYEVFPMGVEYGVDDDGFDDALGAVDDALADLDEALGDDDDDELGASGSRVRKRYIRLVGRFRKVMTKQLIKKKKGRQRRADRRFRKMIKMWQKMKRKGVNRDGLPTPWKVQAEFETKQVQTEVPTGVRATYRRPRAHAPAPRLPMGPPVHYGPGPAAYPAYRPGGPSPAYFQDQAALEREMQAAMPRFGAMDDEAFGDALESLDVALGDLEALVDELGEDDVGDDDDEELGAFWQKAAVRLPKRYMRVVKRYKKVMAKIATKGKKKGRLRRAARRMKRLHKIWAKMKAKGVDRSKLPSPSSVKDAAADDREEREDPTAVDAYPGTAAGPGMVPSLTIPSRLMPRYAAAQEALEADLRTEAVGYSHSGLEHDYYGLRGSDVEVLYHDPDIGDEGDDDLGDEDDELGVGSVDIHELQGDEEAYGGRLLGNKKRRVRRAERQLRKRGFVRRRLRRALRKDRAKMAAKLPRIRRWKRRAKFEGLIRRIDRIFAKLERRRGPIAPPMGPAYGPAYPAPYASPYAMPMAPGGYTPVARPGYGGADEEDELGAANRLRLMQRWARQGGHITRPRAAALARWRSRWLNRFSATRNPKRRQALRVRIALATQLLRGHALYFGANDAEGVDYGRLKPKTPGTPGKPVLVVAIRRRPTEGEAKAQAAGDYSANVLGVVPTEPGLADVFAADLARAYRVNTGYSAPEAMAAISQWTHPTNWIYGGEVDDLPYPMGGSAPLPPPRRSGAEVM
jgi:flagellar biosynthesis GTPase FlhF